MLMKAKQTLFPIKKTMTTFKSFKIKSK